MYQLPVLPFSKPAFEQMLMRILGEQWHRDERQSRTSTSLNSYVERARARYFSRDFYIDPVSRSIEAYTSVVVASDLLLGSHDDIDYIFADFTKSTTVMPNEIDIDPEAQTWDEFKFHVSVLLLHQELITRYPEIEAEDRIRNNKYGS
jgi:hypothetical protein